MCFQNTTTSNGTGAESKIQQDPCWLQRTELYVFSSQAVFHIVWGKIKGIRGSTEWPPSSQHTDYQNKGLENWTRPANKRTVDQRTRFLLVLHISLFIIIILYSPVVRFLILSSPLQIDKAITNSQTISSRETLQNKSTTTTPQSMQWPPSNRGDDYFGS